MHCDDETGYLAPSQILKSCHIKLALIQPASSKAAVGRCEGFRDFLKASLRRLERRKTFTLDWEGARANMVCMMLIRDRGQYSKLYTVASRSHVCGRVLKAT